MPLAEVTHVHRLQLGGCTPAHRSPRHTPNTLDSRRRRVRIASSDRNDLGLTGDRHPISPPCSCRQQCTSGLRVPQRAEANNEVTTFQGDAPCLAVETETPQPEAPPARHRLLRLRPPQEAGGERDVPRGPGLVASAGADQCSDQKIGTHILGSERLTTIPGKMPGF